MLITGLVCLLPRTWLTGLWCPMHPTPPWPRSIIIQVTRPMELSLGVGLILSLLMRLVVIIRLNLAVLLLVLA